MNPIIRVFPRRTSHTPTDDMVFIGNPPLMLPSGDEVHVSCAFTWDTKRALLLADAWRQYYSTVKVGGPAFDDLAGEFTPGLYVREGITTTSRGCNHQCPWCFVPKREGRLRELAIKPGYILQDNNLLQCSRPHLERVFAMCRQQKHAVSFPGGFEAALVSDWVAGELRSLRIGEIWLAADHDAALRPLEKAVHKLHWLPRRKLRCYVLIGYDGEAIADAEARLRAVWDVGVLPFAQLYRDADNSIRWPYEWRQLARTWSRPAAMFALMKQATRR